MNLPEVKSPLVNGRVIKTDCPVKEYLDSKGGENGEPRILGRSDLCAIALCPSKWHKGAVEEERPTPSIEFGSLLDCLLLQPLRFNEYYTLAPDTYTNSKKQVVPWTWKSSTCREWREEQEAAGNLVCTADKVLEAGNAVKALREHPEIGPQTVRLIEMSHHQVFVIAEYHDADTGMIVPVKCLTDIVPSVDDPEFGKSLFDLKTARSARSSIWSKVVYEQNYHVQGAINLDCHNAIVSSDRCDFRHLIVENEPPFEPGRECLQTEFITEGRKLYTDALSTYCKCVQSGKWPTYSPDPGQMVLGDGYRVTQMKPYMIGQQPDQPEFEREPKHNHFEGLPGEHDHLHITP